MMNVYDERCGGALQKTLWGPEGEHNPRLKWNLLVEHDISILVIASKIGQPRDDFVMNNAPRDNKRFDIVDTDG